MVTKHCHYQAAYFEMYMFNYKKKKKKKHNERNYFGCSTQRNIVFAAKQHKILHTLHEESISYRTLNKIKKAKFPLLEE